MLAPLADEYDYVFLDCPPSISLVSESVFEAADALLVPLIPATLSSRTFAPARESSATRATAPQVLGFFSMVDGRKRLHRERDGQLSPPSTPTCSRRRSRRPATSSAWAVNGRRSAAFAPSGRAALAYRELWAEIRERLEPTPATE